MGWSGRSRRQRWGFAAQPSVRRTYRVRSRREKGNDHMSALVVLLVLAVTQGLESSPQPNGAGGRIAEPKRVKYVSPEYPDAARRAGLGGSVVVECTVDTEGRVTSAKALKGSPPLVAAAVSAVTKWRYRQTLLDGKPTPVVFTMALRVF